MTTGSPPSITATTELVVPRSIPMILLILFLRSYYCGSQKSNLCQYEHFRMIIVECPIVKSISSGGPVGAKKGLAQARPFKHPYCSVYKPCLVTASWKPFVAAGMDAMGTLLAPVRISLAVNEYNARLASLSGLITAPDNETPANRPLLRE